MYDILIKNGTVIDGSGAEGYPAEVAVKDGKIVRIAPQICQEASLVIDARGQVVTPGFIDSHSHSDAQFFTNPGQIEKVEQGITTVVAGQCGGSICGADAPQFLENAKTARLGANMALLIGHGTLRKAVMGIENREPTEAELERMKELLASAMEQGALGVSFGLTYVPGCYAKTPELIEMAKVAAAYGGIAAAHIRNEGVTMLDATAEFVEICRQSGVRGIHSHHKVCGEDCWGTVEKSLRLLDEAVAEGIEIYSDVYPYTATHTAFSNAFVPRPWKADGVDALLEKIRQPENIQTMKELYYARHKDLDWILLTRCPGAPEYVGMRMSQVARLRGQEDFEAVLDLITLSRDQAKACFFSVREADMEQVMAHPRVMICTDAGVTSPTMQSYHPRLRGSFPRVLGRYVREKQVVRLPEMIRKMTALPAQVYGFATKGLLKEGFDGDICVFDPQTIRDQADFADPSGHSLGLSWVIVGGQVAARDGYATDALAGKMLYR